MDNILHSRYIKTDIAALTLLCLIFLTPPVIYNYVYPTVGGDTHAHLEVIDSIKAGEPAGIRYAGLLLIGAPVAFISESLDISTDSIFLWLNFAGLIAAGFVLYLIASKLINRKAGLFMIPVALFCTPSILKLFHCGTIFNIINVFIILPLGIFFFIKWLGNNRWVYAITAFCLFALFSFFHPTSIYLQFGLGLFIVGILVYKSITKKRIDTSKMVSFGIIIIVTSIALILQPSQDAGIKSLMISNIYELNIITQWFNPYTDISFNKVALLVNYIGASTLALLTCSIVGLYIYRKSLKVRAETIYLIAFLTSFAIVLGLGYALLKIIEADRVALDMSAIIAIITACLLGVLFSSRRPKVLIVSVLVIMVVGMTPTASIWFSHNSAMRPADIQAVEHVNQLNIETCSYSTQIIPNIYNRFIEKEVVPNGMGDVLIYRDISMNSNATTIEAFVPRENEDTLDKYSNMEILERFEDGRVTIYILGGKE